MAAQSGPVGERGVKYALRPWASVGYFVIFAVAAAAGLGAYSSGVRIPAVESAVPDFYSHASNLTLSLLPMLMYGLIRLLYAARMRELLIVGLVIVAGNFIYEGLLTLWNTKDLTDAWYGTAGVLVALALLTLIRGWGLKPKAAADQAGHQD